MITIATKSRVNYNLQRQDRRTAISILVTTAAHDALVRTSSQTTATVLFHNTPSSTVISFSQTPIDGVFTVEDLVVGTIIAVVLSLTLSFLQSRRSQNDVVLWTTNELAGLQQNTTKCDSMANSTSTTVFDADSWKEMSRPDNYVLFNTKIRRDKNKMTVNRGSEDQQVRSESTRTRSQSTTARTEKGIVFLALLLLFVPIFSVELFFALSRQLLCDYNHPLHQSDWAMRLCSPVQSTMN
jgi:hypothetical protein